MMTISSRQWLGDVIQIDGARVSRRWCRCRSRWVVCDVVTVDSGYEGGCEGGGRNKGRRLVVCGGYFIRERVFYFCFIFNCFLIVIIKEKCKIK